jgi:hypothetical protein
MKSVVGLVLGLVGGIGNILFSILLFIGYILVYLGKGALAENKVSTTLVEFASSLTIWLLVLTIWLLVLGVLGVVFSGMMNNPDKARRGSIGCIVSGILSLNPFLIIGGIMGAVAGRSHEDIIYEG